MTTGDGGEARESIWQDTRRSPATLGLCAVWIAVFVGMCWDQGRPNAGGNALSGGISVAAAHDFGSVTAAEIRAGQYWRAITSTAVHFGVFHLAVNLVAFTLLGRMVEEWYGWAQLVVLYVVIGGLGNLIAAFVKLGRAGLEQNPSGGGSGVICGLIALVAVVGWRSRTKLGRLISNWMLAILGATALLGIMAPQVDNVVHVAGAVVGGFIALFHHTWLRAARTVAARVVGALGLLVLIGSGTIESIHAIKEHGVERTLRGQNQNLLLISGLKFSVYLESSTPGGQFHSREFQGKDRPVRRRILDDWIRQLDRSPIAQTQSADDRAFLRMLEIAKIARRRRPTPGEVHAFDLAFDQVARRIQGDIASTSARLSSLRGLRQVAPGKPVAVKPKPR